MNKILELREKRAKLWDSAKSFLDSRRNDKGLLSAEDTEIYEKMEADIVNLGKEIDRLERQAALDLELSKATSNAIRNNPKAGIQGEKTGRATDEYNNDFWNTMRNKNSFEIQNALQVGTDSEGGFLAPDEFERTLIESFEEQNIFRQLANVIRTSSGDRKIPVVSTKGTASWVDEEGLIPESDDGFGQVLIGAYKLATIIKVSEELLNDSVFNLEQYIAKEFARRIGSKEEEAFFVGDGTGKPTGVFAAAGGAEVGVTAAGATAITLDEIMDLFYSLKSQYRKNTIFTMTDATVKAIRKFKTEMNNISCKHHWCWNTYTILNRPVKTCSYGPNFGEVAKSIAFGDFKYYWVADRQGRSFQRLNELYDSNWQGGFKATLRVDGKLILPEVIKVLKMKRN